MLIKQTNNKSVDKLIQRLLNAIQYKSTARQCRIALHSCQCRNVIINYVEIQLQPQ